MINQCNRKKKLNAKIWSFLLCFILLGSLLTPVAAKAVSTNEEQFNTNASGYGKNKTITIDGAFTDWSEDMKIAQGAANDDARAFRGTHEGPVYDSYGLYGAWDDENLYVMWEFTNVTDVADPAQGYPISDNGKPSNGDIPQILALDLNPSKAADGTISGKGIWGIDVNYANGIDAALYFSSKPGVGTPALFTLDKTGSFSYEPENCKVFKEAGIKYAYGDGNISKQIRGINKIGYNYGELFSSDNSMVDFKTLGHSNSQDTMYEMAIPLKALGIDRNYLENNGIGVMHISTFGASGIASLPTDLSMYDNAIMPYGPDESTSAEKEDLDIITAAPARIGKASDGSGAGDGKEDEKEPEEGKEPEDGSGSEPVEPGQEDYIDLNNNPPVGGSDGPADNMADGAILHAWCWSFNTIKQNMQDIAEAGYTSIQTSPTQQCVIGNGGDLKFTEQWYYHYQPTDYTVGNYQLGTSAEFKAMCDEAEKYGIKIIVDVVANHCTSDYSKISQTIKNKPNFFHTNVPIGDNEWNDRYSITQKALLGLWDNNTQNQTVQNYILDFLKESVSLGADGFRYDAAKHVELPDDAGYGGNFWPYILNNGSEFQYGEILQDSSTSRESAYANYMSVTASNFGINLRNNVKNNNLSVSSIMNWNIGVASDKMVTWVESHDNYANAIHDWGSSQGMTDEQVKLSWAIVGARKGGTPLFFSRPAGGGGKGDNVDNRFPEQTKMGDRGSDLFMDDEVAAVNKFRNAMVDQGEYLRNPNSSSKILMIERGTKGLVVINANYSDTILSSATNLENGTFTNQTDNNNMFQVTNGVITGTLPARSVVVLYESTGSVNGPSAFILQPSQSFYTEAFDLTLKHSANAVRATYCINGGKSYSYKDGTVITIGTDDGIGTIYDIELRAITAEGITVSKTYQYKKAEQSDGFVFTFEKPSSWGNTIYAYVYDESGSSVKEAAPWPGVAMTNTGSNQYTCEIEEIFDNPLVIFTDKSNQSPGASKAGFALVESGHYTIDGLKQESGGTDGVVVYFKKPDNWGSTIYAYVYDESGGVQAVAPWPGVTMTVNSASGYYTYTFDINYSNGKIIFSDGNHQTPGANQTGFSLVNKGVYGQNGLEGTYSSSITEGTLVLFEKIQNFKHLRLKYDIAA